MHIKTYICWPGCCTASMPVYSEVSIIYGQRCWATCTLLYYTEEDRKQRAVRRLRSPAPPRSSARHLFPLNRFFDRWCNRFVKHWISYSNNELSVQVMWVSLFVLFYFYFLIIILGGTCQRPETVQTINNQKKVVSADFELWVMQSYCSRVQE